MGAAVGRVVLLRRRPRDDARQPRLRGRLATANERDRGKILIQRWTNCISVHFTYTNTHSYKCIYIYKSYKHIYIMY